MKLRPATFMSVVITLVAIVAYDRFRGDDGAEPRPAPGTARLAALEARLSALEATVEAEGRRVELEVLERMNRVERRLDRLTSTLTEAGPPAEAPTGPTLEAGGKPSITDVEEFRRLAAEARRLERKKRARKRIDAAVDELQIVLTAEQTDRLVETWGEFGERRDEIWIEAKRQGAAQGDAVDWETIIVDTTRTLRREFTDRISGFIHPTDAEAISANLIAGK